MGGVCVGRGEKGSGGCGGCVSGGVGRNQGIEVARDSRAVSRKVVEEERWRSKEDSDASGQVNGGEVRWRAKWLWGIVKTLGSAEASSVGCGAERGGRK